jgi:MFS transporter, PAT family, beta-lactamase induction signal transducer AmpG
MALGMMLPGLLSGWLQQAVGYRMFFIIVCIMTIPGMLTIPFIVKTHREKTG